MSALSRDLACVERKLLAAFPDRSISRNRLAEFDESFGESCTEAADAVALVSDVMRPADLASLAERVALTVADAIKTAALQVGVAESPWVRQGQRWAVEAYFARIAEVRATMVPGGRA